MHSRTKLLNPQRETALALLLKKKTAKQIPFTPARRCVALWSSLAFVWNGLSIYGADIDFVAQTHDTPAGRMGVARAAHLTPPQHFVAVSLIVQEKLADERFDEAHENWETC